jgi:hypothetical protein
LDGIDPSPEGRRQNFQIGRSNQGQLPVVISTSQGMITMETPAALGYHRARRLNTAPSGWAQSDPGQLKATRVDAVSHRRRASQNGS